ncbi:MAG TPA: apolipoprotein N-acyltransferase [Actinomycetota bacterium]|nr:apolipoprotein N-acyltransferase [Actinomycetota bacterium]
MPARGRAFAAALFSGVALTFAFPEPDLFFVAWFALVPLIIIARRATPGRGAALAFVFGLGFFGTLLYWISIVGWVAWALLVLLQAGLLALFGVAIVLIARLEHLALRVILTAAAWTAVELLRSIVPIFGFTWGQLAQSQHNAPWMLRPAALGGAWAVASIVCAVNVLLARAWVHRGSPSAAAIPTAVAAVLLFGPLLLPGVGRAEGAPARVAIVQGNVPLEIPETGAAREEAILARHLELTRDLAERDLDLIVWPESSIGIDLDRDPVARATVESATRVAGAAVIAGANLDVDADRYLVMAFHIDPEHGLVDRYQKTHLVPYGEYVPGRRFLNWVPMLAQVPRDAIAGRHGKLFTPAAVPGPVAPVISFEGDFGSLVRARIASGGRLLIVATNTSTWRRSWASAQHVAMSQVRAAENGVWALHAALSGISALIAPDGSVVDRTPLWTATTLEGDVYLPDGVSFYARTGDWWAWGSAVLAVAGAVVGWRRRPRRAAV